MKNAFFRIPKEWGILFFWLSSFSWAESNVCTGLFSKIRNNIGAATRLTEDVKLGDSYYRPIFDEADWADVVQDSSLYGNCLKEPISKFLQH